MRAIVPMVYPFRWYGRAVAEKVYDSVAPGDGVIGVRTRRDM